MSARVPQCNPVVLSYYALRRAVGLIALSLPFALAGGTILLAVLGPSHHLPRPVLEHSISDYYYSPMHNVLVGSLCAIASFLICSRGYDLADEITGYVAGISTLGVALFPSVNPRVGPSGGHYTPMQVDIGFAHSGFAGIMFLALAYFCLVLFRRTSPERRLTRRKQHRNRIYLACGLVILVCSLVMGMVSITAVERMLDPVRPLFICETLSLLAFGVAWLTKGEGILRDRSTNHARSS